MSKKLLIWYIVHFKCIRRVCVCMQPSLVSRLVVVDTVPGKSKPIAETPDMVNLVYKMAKFKLAARRVHNIDEKKQRADAYLKNDVQVSY